MSFPKDKRDFSTLYLKLSLSPLTPKFILHFLVYGTSFPHYSKVECSYETFYKPK